MTTENKDTIITCRNLSKIYRMGGQKVAALHDMNLDVLRGEYLSVMGPSGSGKSTLFNMIGALDRPSSGTVTIGGADLTQQSKLELAYFRNHHIGYIFQAFNLIPVFTAYENVSFIMLLQKRSKEEMKKRAEELLVELGLEKKIHSRPKELSGGEQQRVAVARALAARPKFILADEPTASLDTESAMNLLDMMEKMNREEGVTFVFSTHDQRVIDRARRVITLVDGAIDEDIRRDEME
mgnify:CR=1 FL=1